MQNQQKQNAVASAADGMERRDCAAIAFVSKQMSTMTPRPLLTLAAAALLAASCRAVVIDDFTLAPVELQKRYDGVGAVTNSLQTGLDPAHVAGGVRNIRFDRGAAVGSNPDPADAVRVAVRPEPTPHLAYEADEPLTAINLFLTYNAGATSVSQPGLNLNLGALRHNALVIDFNFANFYDNNGRLDISAVTGKFTPVPNSATPFRLVHAMTTTPIPGNTLLKSVSLGTGNGYLHGQFEIARITTASTADANFDGAIDGADFLTWQRNAGTVLPATATNADRVTAGDVNLDGMVDGVDLVYWQQLLSPAQAAPNAAATPEPATLALLAIASLVVDFQRRIRRDELTAAGGRGARHVPTSTLPGKTPRSSSSACKPLPHDYPRKCQGRLTFFSEACS